MPDPIDGENHEWSAEEVTDAVGDRLHEFFDFGFVVAYDPAGRRYRIPFGKMSRKDLDALRSGLGDSSEMLVELLDFAESGKPQQAIPDSDPPES